MLQHGRGVEGLGWWEGSKGSLRNKTGGNSDKSIVTWDGGGVLLGLWSCLLQPLRGLRVAPLPNDTRPIVLPVLLPAILLLPSGMLCSNSAQRGLLEAGERLAMAWLVSPDEGLVGTELSASSALTESS